MSTRDKAKDAVEPVEPVDVEPVEPDEDEDLWSVRDALEFLAQTAGLDLADVKQLRYTRNRDRLDFMLDDRTMVRLRLAEYDAVEDDQSGPD